jgi:hypothetical protein
MDYLAQSVDSDEDKQSSPIQMKEEEKEAGIEPVTADASSPLPAVPTRPGAVQASLAAKIYFKDQETIL